MFVNVGFVFQSLQRKRERERFKMLNSADDKEASLNWRFSWLLNTIALVELGVALTGRNEDVFSAEFLSQATSLLVCLLNYMKLNGVVNEIKLMFFYHFSMCQFIVSPHVFCKESRREAPKEPGCIWHFFTRVFLGLCCFFFFKKKKK